MLHNLIIIAQNKKITGHSLGAHIAGATGRYLTQKTEKLLPRITG